MKMQPVSYHFKDNTHIDYGVIAQDILEIPELKQLVIENNDGMYSVNYIGMVGIILRAIQELKELIDSK